MTALPPPPPDDLLGRVVAGARAGSLVITPSEYARLRVNAGPQSAVIVDGSPVLVWSLPMHVLPDSVDDLAIIPGHPTSPMHWQLLASYHDDLLDLDDLARLWHHPAETDHLEPPF